MKITLKKLLVALFAVVCISTTAFADEVDPNVARAYELDIIYDNMANKSKEEITRKEFAETLVNFYRKTTGRSGITLNIDKFFDTRSICLCYKVHGCVIVLTIHTPDMDMVYIQNSVYF